MLSSCMWGTLQATPHLSLPAKPLFVSPRLFPLHGLMLAHVAPMPPTVWSLRHADKCSASHVAAFTT